MFGFRFSLAQMAAMTTVVCLGCAAIVSANSITASLCLSIFFIANLVAFTGSLTTAGAARSFWIGMAVFGWAYWWQHEPTLLRDEMGDRARYMSYPYSYSPYLGGMMSYGGNSTSPPPRLSSEWLLDRIYLLTARSPKIGEKVIARWMGSGLYPGVVKEIDEQGFVVQWDDGSAPSPVAARDVMNEGNGFFVTGHSVFGVLFGLLGGMLGLAFFGPKGEEPVATPASTAAPTTPSPAAPPA